MSEAFKTYNVQVLGIDGGKVVGWVEPDSGLLMDLEEDRPLGHIRKNNIMSTPLPHHRKDLDGKKALVWIEHPVMRQFNYQSQKFEVVE